MKVSHRLDNGPIIMREVVEDKAVGGGTQFLPLPVEQDPLLLHWFGDQLPWLLEKDESLRSSCYGLSQAIME